MSIILDVIESCDPEKIAVVGDDRSLTYSALFDEIEACAVDLVDVSVLGIALDNGIDWLVWDLAAIKLGIPCVPLPPFFTKQQQDYVIATAGITHISMTHGLVPTGIEGSSKIPVGTAKVTFTSGTTGTPKGVCLPQIAIDKVAQSLVEVLGTEIAENHISILPLSVLLENVAGVYATLLAGGTAHIFSAGKVGMGNPFAPDFVMMAHIMSAYHASAVILVPELLRGLMQVVAQTKLALPELKFMAVGGSKVAPELVMQARALGLPVYEGYGLSECASVVALNTPDNDKIGTVGKVLPHLKAAIKDNQIVIKDSPYLGYLGEPKEGALHTGDLGTLDEQGFLKIDGRKKNILITSHGRNISPEWVESALLARPEILQAVIIGDAQPFLSALIVPASEAADINAAIARANETLPQYAHIKTHITVPPLSVAEGTLTGTGRPRRDVVFNKFQSQIETLIIKEKYDELLQSSG